jgi:glycine cleavage system pyridoxal-binding protein P
MTSLSPAEAHALARIDGLRPAMLAEIGYASRQALIRDTVPAAILRDAPLDMVAPTTEAASCPSTCERDFRRTEHMHF